MKFLQMICLAVLVLCGGKVAAEEETGKVLVIAADHSKSMLDNVTANWRHIQIQATAVENVFSTNRYDCGDLTVVYFAWSLQIHGELALDLSTTDRAEFLAGVEALAADQSGRGTEHSAAYYHAEQIFSRYPDHEHYLLVTTDEAGDGYHFSGIVPDAKVFAVAYTPESATYAAEYMATESWNVQLATNVEDATTALTFVLNEILAEVCTGA